MSTSDSDGKRMELALATLLRTGTIFSAIVVAIGGVAYLVASGAATPELAVFHGEPADLRSFGGVVDDVIALKPRGIIQLGLLLLVATPIARVAASLVGFIAQRDRLYIVTSSLVLAALLYSLLAS